MSHCPHRIMAFVACEQTMTSQKISPWIVSIALIISDLSYVLLFIVCIKCHVTPLCVMFKWYMKGHSEVADNDGD